jgi:LPS sulfotransferase NodH
MPESYFRRADVDDYADRWAVPRDADGALDFEAYVGAAMAAGSTVNGVFGARIMWGTMTALTNALAAVTPGRATSQRALLTRAFGRTRFVHLRRMDVVAQAVSWARAEQTHFWHPEEAVTPGGHEPLFDRDMIGRLVDTIQEHETAWHNWFVAQGLAAHQVTYEQLTADPVAVTQAVLDFLGLELPADQAITAYDGRQSDAINADWITRFRAESADH